MQGETGGGERGREGCSWLTRFLWLLCWQFYENFGLPKNMDYLA